MNPVLLFRHLQRCGLDNQSPRTQRQIVLSNQIGLSGTLATLPYQVFYLVFDAGLLAGLLVFNLFIMGAYLLVPWMNQNGHHNRSRDLALSIACVQILVVTWWISSAAGVHLYFFSLGGAFFLIFSAYRRWWMTLLILLTALLFLLSHFAFPPDRALVPLPHEVLNALFVYSAAGAFVLAAAFSYLFRSEIERAEKQLMMANTNLEQLSETDPLTGLSNRRGMEAYLGHLQKTGEGYAFILGDIDHFKHFNDTYGHQEGDQCLQKVAQVLTETVRRPQDRILRYGGEEFAIILPGTNLEEATHIAERIRFKIAGQPGPDASPKDSITMSFGVSCSPQSSADPGAVIEAADRSLYRAKSEGRNCTRSEALHDASQP